MWQGSLPRLPHTQKTRQHIYMFIWSNLIPQKGCFFLFSERWVMSDSSVLMSFSFCKRLHSACLCISAVPYSEPHTGTSDKAGLKISPSPLSDVSKMPPGLLEMQRHMWMLAELQHYCFKTFQELSWTFMFVDLQRISSILMKPPQTKLNVCFQVDLKSGFPAGILSLVQMCSLYGGTAGSVLSSALWPSTIFVWLVCAHPGRMTHARLNINIRAGFCAAKVTLRNAEQLISVAPVLRGRVLEVWSDLWYFGGHARKSSGMVEDNERQQKRGH